MSVIWQPFPRWYLAAELGVTGGYGAPRGFNIFESEFDTLSDNNGLYYAGGPNPPWFGTVATRAARAMCWVGSLKSFFVVVPNSGVTAGQTLFKCDEFLTSATIISLNFTPYPGAPNPDLECARLVNYDGGQLFAYSENVNHATASSNGSIDSISYAGARLANQETIPYVNAPNSGTQFQDRVYFMIAQNRRDFVTIRQWFVNLHRLKYVGGHFTQYEYRIGTSRVYEENATNGTLYSSIFTNNSSGRELIYGISYDLIQDRILFVSETYASSGGNFQRTTAKIRQLTRPAPLSEWSAANSVVGDVCDLPFVNVVTDGELGTINSAERPWLAWTSGETNKMYYYAFQGSEPFNETWDAEDYENAGLFQYDLDGTNREPLQKDFLRTWYEGQLPEFGRPQYALGPGTRAPWEI